jgi:hypothetical protein
MSPDRLRALTLEAQWLSGDNRRGGANVKGMERKQKKTKRTFLVEEKRRSKRKEVALHS